MRPGPIKRARRAKPDLDAGYLVLVATFPCRWCDGLPTVPHHVTFGRGFSKKACDTDTIPLCEVHHRALHDGTSPFKGWSKDQRRIWQLEELRLFRLDVARKT